MCKGGHKENGKTKRVRYYLGNYEEETDSIGNVRKIHYLAGGSLFIQNCGNDTLLYAYHDFQGSLIALTDEDGNVVERYAYDPWGARRNSEKWEEKDQRTNHLIDRGYTGHEHIDAFAIINMNGRIYDPLTATFFSVDPYVQSPDDWLNYNRYAYCMFNPFLYVDPSGYNWFSKLGNWFRNNWQSIVTTTVTVAAGVAVGAIIVASCGTAAPLLVAASAGMAAGFAGGVTHGILSGQSIGDIMKSGLIGAGKGLLFGTLGGVASTFAPAGALWGSLYGAGTGSFIGMVGSAMTGDDITEGMIFGAASGFFGGFFQGYCSAKNQGLNPWTGAKLPETTVNTPNMMLETPKETETPTTNSQIKQNRINGRIAEDVSGIDQSSKARIPSATGTAKYRIPDELTNSTLREIKNVSYLDYTPQLQDFVSYSQQHNLQMILQVRPENTVFGPGTTFSPALNNAIIQYNIKVDYIPFPNKFIINF